MGIIRADAQGVRGGLSVERAGYVEYTKVLKIKIAPAPYLGMVSTARRPVSDRIDQCRSHKLNETKSLTESREN